MACISNNPFIDAFKAFMDTNNYFGSNTKSSFPYDMNGALSAQRHAIEAYSAISQTVAESMQAVVRRQAEIFQSQAADMFDLVKEISAAPSPEATLSKNAAFVRNSLENAWSNTKELAEMVSKSNIEVFDLLGKRIADNVTEATNVVKKKAA